jgi:S-adenosylmethionine decarboxylase
VPSLGTHLLLEMAGCPSELLNDEEGIRRALLRAVMEANATILGSSFHKFSPQGVSGVVVIAESHLSIHTWPEFGYAAVDVFTCGDRAMPHKAVEHLIEVFTPTHYDLREMSRGLPESYVRDRGISDEATCGAP